MSIDDPFHSIRSIVSRNQIQLDAEEFQAIVNDVFHSFESVVYDDIHQDMWRSLPLQFDLLAEDVLQRGKTDHLSLIDVGCGTGLSTELILRSPLGPHIDHVTLLDPSPEMLTEASKRMSAWPIDRTIARGFLGDLPSGQRYDLVLACSVLHHIPSLPEFCRDVTERTTIGSYFVHLQDLNGDVQNDDRASARVRALEERLGEKSLRDRFRIRHLRGKLRSVFPRLRPRSYIDDVNDELKRRGVIRAPLTDAEVWTVTDVHVYSGKGISIPRINEMLPEFRLCNQRSYGFFGRLWSELPEPFRQEEERMIAAGEKDGHYVAAVWQRQ